MRKPFRFKKFSIIDTHCAMKVSTDAVLLGAWADVSSSNHVLDIGTGSGIIAIMLAQRSEARIDAIDIHGPSCDDADLNFSNCIWHERLELYRMSLSDFLINCNSGYDLVVCNPPYHSKSLKSPSENVNISRHTTTLTHGELVKGVKSILQPYGRFCVILSPSEIQNFIQLAKNHGLFCKLECRIFPKPDKPLNRVMLEFSMFPETKINSSQIILRDSTGAYHLSYMELTSHFYLNF
jgi:tRNA1Val (adenine37-N6)-methyltransferase